MFALWVNRRRLLSDPKKLGIWGERRCERYLKSLGCRIISRNFKCALGEIDLIAADKEGRIIFVEVKTRRNEDFARAERAVNPRKRQKLIRTAKYFVKTYRMNDVPLRFDVVAVVLGTRGKPQIRHYENAFRP
jgi:putative endonuclease